MSFSPLFLSYLPHLLVLIHLFSSSLLSLGDHAQIGSRGETSRVTCNHLLKEILTMTRRRSDSSGTVGVMAGKWLLVAEDNQPDETSCSFEESRCIVDRQPATSNTFLSVTQKCASTCVKGGTVPSRCSDVGSRSTSSSCISSR